LLVSGVTTVAAQESTPVTDDVIEVLFVQTATSSTLTPLDGGDNGATHELVMSGGPDQAVYFADRPNRQAGTVSIADAVPALTADSDSRTNAALVAQTSGGSEEIVVVELISGEVDTGTGDVTFQVVLLADFGEIDLAFASEPITEVADVRVYEASHLFIDDVCINVATGVPYDC
jgi:hypothetical protein